MSLLTFIPIIGISIKPYLNSKPIMAEAQHQPEVSAGITFGLSCICRDKRMDRSIAIDAGRQQMEIIYTAPPGLW